MRFISCYIAGFGRLSDKNFDLNKDIVEIKADNGSGKTTLAAFLESMLFGLDAGRGRAVDGNDRLKYEPWQGGAFGGSLCFSHAGKTYRIERRFGKTPAADTVKLYDKNNLLCYEFGENVDKIGELLLGVNRDTYRKSAYIPQGAIVSGELPEDAKARLVALLSENNDKDGAAGGAIRRLDEAERALRAKRAPAKGKLDEIDERIERLSRALDETERSVAQLHQNRAAADDMRLRIKRAEEERAKLTSLSEKYLRESGEYEIESQARKDLQERIARASEELARLNELYVEHVSKREDAPKKTDSKGGVKKKKTSKIVIFAAFVCLIAGLFLLPTAPEIGGIVFAVGGGVIAFVCIAYIIRSINWRKKGEKDVDITPKEWERLHAAAQREYDEARTDLAYLPKDEGAPMTAEVEMLKTRIAATERERDDLTFALARLSAETETLEKTVIAAENDRAERETLLAEKARLERRLQAVRAAKEILLRARENMAARYLEPVEKKCREYGVILRGNAAFDTLRFAADGSPVFEESGSLRSLAYYSAGTKELVDLCTRLALAESLFAGSFAPVLVLDDPLVNLDDSATAKAKRLIKSLAKKYQIVYFTCKEERSLTK